MGGGGARAAGLLVGMAVDTVVGDPRRGHPVAAFGRLASVLEQRVHRDSTAVGAAYCLVLVGAAVAVGTTVERGLRDHRRGLLAATAVATWAVVGAASLRHEAMHVASALTTGNMHAARRRLPALCGRDPSTLDEKEITRAVVESVAENTADAVVGPLFWGVVAGVPGLLAYRAVNTLDAMVGHRSSRYARFGMVAARLDDLANLVPARITGVLTCALAPLAGGSPAAAWRALRRDGSHHPSPNAGRCEAAFAGALGVRLGGVNRYESRVEHRPELGSGVPPSVEDIGRAVRLSAAVGVAAGLLAAVATGLWVRR